MSADGLPDLRNLDVGFCVLNSGDFIMLLSDGIHDNLDPELLGHNPRSLGLNVDSWDAIPKSKAALMKAVLSLFLSHSSRITCAFLMYYFLRNSWSVNCRNFYGAMMRTRY